MPNTITDQYGNTFPAYRNAYDAWYHQQKASEAKDWRWLWDYLKKYPAKRTPEAVPAFQDSTVQKPKLPKPTIPQPQTKVASLIKLAAAMQKTADYGYQMGNMFYGPGMWNPGVIANLRGQKRISTLDNLAQQSIPPASTPQSVVTPAAEPTPAATATEIAQPASATPTSNPTLTPQQLAAKLTPVKGGFSLVNQQKRAPGIYSNTAAPVQYNYSLPRYDSVAGNALSRKPTAVSNGVNQAKILSGSADYMPQTSKNLAGRGQVAARYLDNLRQQRLMQQSKQRRSAQVAANNNALRGKPMRGYYKDNATGNYVAINGTAGGNNFSQKELMELQGPQAMPKRQVASTTNWKTVPQQHYQFKPSLTGKNGTSQQLRRNLKATV